VTDKQSSLDQFHPLVRQWFKERFGKPTDIQEKSWPKIAMGEHVLITAPTGSGKTLTAFLWAIDQLITGRYPSGHTSILYISPLKALNNDIQRNLIKPLEEGVFLIGPRSLSPLPKSSPAVVTLPRQIAVKCSDTLRRSSSQHLRALISC